MITNLYVGSVGEASAVLDGTSKLRPDFAANGLDNSVLAELWAAIDPDAPVDQLQGEGCIVAFNTNGPWVFELPADFVAALAAAPSAQDSEVCSAWADGYEMRHLGVGAGDLGEPLAQIKAVAEKAMAGGQSVLLLMAV